VAKLAVRANNQQDGGRITIGLFALGSHDVVDCATNCPAHHASINRAVQCLQEICRRHHHHHPRSSSNSSSSSSSRSDQTSNSRMMIPAYSEQSGHGCFRYVQCQVERATGAVQITLVWRKDARYDAALKFLCQEIIKIANNNSSSSIAKYSSASASAGGAAAVKQKTGSNDDGPCDYSGDNGFLLHSLWVHYNNAGKHENSIVSRSAGVHTMQCTVDELHEMGQDGSWVHIPVTSSSSSSSSAVETTSARDKNTRAMKGSSAFLSSGVVVEHLDQVLLRRHSPCDRGVADDDDDVDAHDDDHDQTTSRGRSLLSVPLHFAPNVFRQANLDGFTAIVAKIRSYFQSYLKKQQQQQQQQHSINVVELYGGVGTIGLHLADLCTSLVCSDENPYNQSCFHAAVHGMQWSTSSSKNWESSSFTKKKHKKHRKTKKEDQNNNINNNSSDDAPTMIRYEPQSATTMVQNISLLRDADWIIVDPPRKGLDEAVIQALCLYHHHDGPNQVRTEQQQTRQQQQQPKQQVLVYVSCGFDAFQRDFGQLTTMGSKPWKLSEAEGHILFPGSDAIEVLAFFTR
jgi:tRNA/tmRNA/rRNA uracil-C5-methylase (TrmA/RlmC/RlmD family)